MFNIKVFIFYSREKYTRIGITILDQIYILMSCDSLNNCKRIFTDATPELYSRNIIFCLLMSQITIKIVHIEYIAYKIQYRRYSYRLVYR